MIETGLYQFLTSNSFISALLGGQTSVYFSVLPKQPVLPAIRLFRVASPNAAETLDASSAGNLTIAGRFQIDSLGQDGVSASIRQTTPVNPSGYLSAALLSQAIRAQLLANTAGDNTLPDGTLLQDIRIRDEFDADFEQGGTGYIFRRVLDVEIIYEEGNYPYSPGTSGGAVSTWMRYSNFASPPTLAQVGSSATWTLSVPFTANAMVFRNGELLGPGVDYTTSGSSITFVVPSASSDNLIVMQ